MWLTKSTDYQKIHENISKDRVFRKKLCSINHTWFLTTYLNSHVEYESAEFQKEMLRLTEDIETEFIVIVAFRGSAKSTIMALSYPLWAMLGVQQKKHIVLISQTQTQAKQLLANIRAELEANQLLIDDYGPFQEDASQWSATTLVLTSIGTRITSVSSGESIRGIKHKNYRPDLIICDDVESTESVKTKDGRDKTYKWLTGDVIPSGDINTKTIVVGNLLHEDSLIMRLKDAIENKVLKGVYKEYPLLDDRLHPLWSGKFKTDEDIRALRLKTGNEIAFKREYLLQIVPDVDAVVHKDWIHYYGDVPSINSPRFWFGVVGVDLAISQSSRADKTAMVTILVFGNSNDWNAYVIPNPINARLTFPQTIDTVCSINSLYNFCVTLCIEKVAYQDALVQQLHSKGISSVGVTVESDKRSRLAITSASISSGHILFPQNGAADLINQITGFGVERYDDLVDAFSIAMREVLIKVSTPTFDYTFV